jgi:hypothetical protein
LGITIGGRSFKQFQQITGIFLENLVLVLARLIGRMVKGVVITRDEIDGFMIHYLRFRKSATSGMVSDGAIPSIKTGAKIA